MSEMGVVLGGRCSPRTMGALLSRGNELDLYVGPGEWEPIDTVNPRIQDQPYDPEKTYVICQNGVAYRVWAEGTVPCRIVQKGSRP